MTGAEAFRRPPNAPPRIYGHRGARAHAPENTLAALERAWTDGADGIELDVRVTADGEVLVLHDPSFALLLLAGGAQLAGGILAD